MSAPRIFHSPLPLSPGRVITLDIKWAHYLLDVLRLGPGQEVTLFDDSGKRALGTLLPQMQVRIDEALPPVHEPQTSLVLVQGILKGQKMDTVVEKAVELGASKIVPVVTERTIVKDTRKVERWRKIALEAARQSGRGLVPEVSEPTTWHAVFTSEARMQGYVFWEHGGELPTPPANEQGHIIAAIGPEGGLTEHEVQAACTCGLAPATLGQFTLRAETASIAALAILSHLIRAVDFSMPMGAK